MTVTLPKNAVDLLAGIGRGGDIAKALHTAYWLHGRDDGAALYHLRMAHQQFAALAEALGYEITPKAKPRRVIAERDQLGSFVGWRAHCDDLGADTSPYGYGATEAEAIANLERLIEEAAQ
jgi:hypothetical protein